MPPCTVSDEMLESAAAHVWDNTVTINTGLCTACAMQLHTVEGVCMLTARSNEGTVIGRKKKQLVSKWKLLIDNTAVASAIAGMD